MGHFIPSPPCWLVGQLCEIIARGGDGEQCGRLNEKLTLFFEKKMSTVGLLAANALQGPHRCGLGGTITVLQKM